MKRNYIYFTEDNKSVFKCDAKNLLKADKLYMRAIKVDPTKQSGVYVRELIYEPHNYQSMSFYRSIDRPKQSHDTRDVLVSCLILFFAFAWVAILNNYLLR